MTDATQRTSSTGRWLMDGFPGREGVLTWKNSDWRNTTHDGGSNALS